MNVTRAAEVLGVPLLEFVEPSFADLIDIRYNALIASLPGDDGLLLVDERDEPIALALGDEGTWLAGSFHLRRPNTSVIERFEETGGEIYQEERSVWAEAVRDYYSTMIMRETTPACDDLNPARPAMIASLISDVWADEDPCECLDCCCGSGAGSLVLRDAGFSPISYDNDPSLLSLGLHTGRLSPVRTICIDGTLASRYINPVHLGIGLMLGEIHSFNRALWQKIVKEIMQITERALFTVGTGNEADMVREWVSSLGNDVRIFENTRDPIYDRWVCDITARKAD